MYIKEPCGLMCTIKTVNGAIFMSMVNNADLYNVLCVAVHYLVCTGWVVVQYPVRGL